MTCLVVNGQNSSSTENLPFIEVTGTASQKVVPDIINIEIIITEKTISRKTYTIAEQEAALKSILNSLNIDMNKLSLSDSDASIIYKRRREKGKSISKEYQLELNSANQVSAFFDALSNTPIKEATITKTEHSDIINIRKNVRIAAIKAAKDKAVYLLEAIGEDLGKALEIKEYNPESRYSNANNRTNMAYAQDFVFTGIEFKPIEVKFSYYVKYGIK